MRLFAGWKELLVSFAVTLLVTPVLFWPIVTNLSTQLYDWNDYPLMVWIIDQHIDHITRGEWAQFFQSNLFYPFSETLLFSDLLLPSAILVLLVKLVVGDLLAAFNVVFLGTWLLNGVAAWYLWRQMWRKEQLVLATLLTTFMPFAIINTSHFQMITLWPFLFGAAWLFAPKVTHKQAIWVGVWLSITFVSSVYLAVFLAAIVGVWWLVQIGADYWISRNRLKEWLVWAAMCGAVAAVLAGPFAFQYYQMRQSYQAHRQYIEYVNYAAGMLDYFSSGSLRSVVGSIPVVAKWNSMIATSAGGYFPGLVLLGLAVAAFGVAVSRKKRRVSLQFSLSRTTLIFSILLVIGFIFSFGPRMKIGSVYIGPPLPYTAVLKLIPLVEPIRVTARWMLLFSFGLVYLSSVGWKRIAERLKERFGNTAVGIFLVCTLLAFGLEVLPFNRSFAPAQPGQLADLYLIEPCRNSPVLLEYPFIYNPHGDGRGVIDMLQHWTSIVLDATEHDCRVINGYSGFFPAEYDQYAATTSAALEESSVASFSAALRDRDVQLLRIHTDKVTATEAATLQAWQTSTSAELLSDQDTIQLLLVPDTY